MITEEDAQTKWCPQARVAGGEAGNRYSMDIDAAKAHAFAKCIGSNCMMWRSEIIRETCKVPQSKPPGTVFGWERTGAITGTNDEPLVEWARTIRKGYCGLAGRPIIL